MAKVPVTVYTKSNCPQCTMTKKKLDQLGIIYTEVNLEDHPDQVAAFKEQGLMAAPIVTTDTKAWSGFKLGKIESLAHFIFSAEREDKR
jgi:glutaredoxin-like protein NrdH